MLSSIFVQVESAIQEKDGETLKSLFDEDVIDKYYRGDFSDMELQMKVEENFADNNWRSFMLAFVRCMNKWSNGLYANAFVDGLGTLKSLDDISRSYDGENWTMSLLKKLTVLIRCLSLICENDERGEKDDHYYSTKLSEQLTSLFRMCTSDIRTKWEQSRRIATMHITNQLLRIYFPMNQLQLCNPLLRTIDQMGDDLSKFYPLDERITYYYYTGRMCLLKNQIDDSVKRLEYAYTHCRQENEKNKRMILLYLVPLKMRKGFIPQTEILLKFDLELYIPIVEAIRIGNVGVMQELLNDKKTKYFLLKSNVFLLFYHLMNITYRNLCQRIVTSVNTHQIPFDAFRVCFEWMREKTQKFSFIQTSRSPQRIFGIYSREIGC
ncbi:hypothetical protein SNEBB_003867 [Seison nebaliae]|nr:hypothetical protein SNEBB_003867 [Seison nebaliae]